jgi:hypothetical protein
LLSVSAQAAAIFLQEKFATWAIHGKRFDISALALSNVNGAAIFTTECEIGGLLRGKRKTTEAMGRPSQF